MPTLKQTLPAIALLMLVACSEPEVVIDQPIDANEVTSETDVTEGEMASSESSIASVSSANANSNQSKSTSVRIAMAFGSQAPHANWNPPYDEACEEASLIIVHHYLEGTPLNPNIMDKGILDMVAFEESKGLPIDIDMFQLADVAKEMFGYETEVLEGNDVRIERIEEELAKGNPIIVPLAGQDIGNPNYTGDGPPYHVLVILGYDSKNFITHDVGTRKGENYVYRKEVIMDAIHDWNGSVDTIRSGPRRLLVVTK